MKKLVILVIIATFSSSVMNAQVIATTCEHANFFGFYAPENWDLFGEVSFNGLDEIELTGTIVEIYGGGGGNNPPDEQIVVASAEVMVMHQGILFFEYNWPIFAPDCLERHAFINDTQVSVQMFGISGYPVYPGDVLHLEIRYYPYEAECFASSWNFSVDEFKIVGDCGQFDFEPCPPPTPDLNGDGVVNAMDLLILLAQFGQEV